VFFAIAMGPIVHNYDVYEQHTSQFWYQGVKAYGALYDFTTLSLLDDCKAGMSYNIKDHGPTQGHDLDSAIFKTQRLRDQVFSSSICTHEIREWAKLLVL
jgi:hypothetical protein